jgi:hypothetical protein
LAADGLRMIQIDRHDLSRLPTLVEELRRVPHRFVVYCDDLSFEGHDDAYKSLKSVLDGALTGPPRKRAAVCHVKPPPPVARVDGR